MPKHNLLGGTDGFRGHATTDLGPGLINEETFALATYALVERQLELGLTGPVIIGQDTRKSGDRLRRASIAGALMHDVKVLDLRVAPTPVLQKVALELGAMATVAVTASHNHHNDNGWKGMVGSDKPSKEIVSDISNHYWNHVESGLTVPTDSLYSDNLQWPELLTWYADEVIADIQKQFGDKPLAGRLFVIDGAYGAGQTITPAIFRRLGAEVEEFCCDESGSINDGCGAADLSGLASFLKNRPDITSNSNFIGALANDGDADRVMSIGFLSTASGAQLVEVNGNHAMGLHAMGEPGIVGTEYTNSGLVRMLELEGIGFEYCKNGDIFVTQALREKQSQGEPWRRGGEFTGHHVDTDWLSSGDGVRMAAWLAAYASSKELTFGSIHQDIPLWSERMAKVKLPVPSSQYDLGEDQMLQKLILQTEQELGDEGRLIIRPSGTEPLVRVWGEGKQQHAIDKAVRRIEETIKHNIESGQ